MTYKTFTICMALLVLYCLIQAIASKATPATIDNDIYSDHPKITLKMIDGRLDQLQHEVDSLEEQILIMHRLLDNKIDKEFIPEGK